MKCLESIVAFTNQYHLVNVLTFYSYRLFEIHFNSHNFELNCIAYSFFFVRHCFMLFPWHFFQNRPKWNDEISIWKKKRKRWPSLNNFNRIDIDRQLYRLICLSFTLNWQFCFTLFRTYKQRKRKMYWIRQTKSCNNSIIQKFDQISNFVH